MSIASRIFLAATLAAGLTVSGGAQAAVQGFSISLTDVTFERGSNLSAEAAAVRRTTKSTAGNTASEQWILQRDGDGRLHGLRHSAAVG
jgi:hypothetical protein